VSVLISARNEEKDIGWKVRQTLKWDYPGELEVLVASDASEDGTDAVLQSIDHPRLRYTRMAARSGKNAALNRLAQMACGELLLFTDANTHTGADRLRRMVRHFADRRVGCVTGVEQPIRQERDTVVELGVRSFLSYDAFVKSCESRIGSVLVCDGALFCMRRKLFTNLDPDLANDLELPLRVARLGYWRLCELGASPSEKSTHSAREEFSRRSRICGQGILALWRLRGQLRGLCAFQFLSCKLLRWFALLPILMLLVGSALLVPRPMFNAILAVQVLFYTLAAVGAVLSLRNGSAGQLASLPFYFVLANVAAFVGVLESCFGRRFRVWEIASLSRGHEQARQT